MKHIAFLIAFIFAVIFTSCKDVVTSSEQKNIDVTTNKFVVLNSATTDFGTIRIGTVAQSKFSARDTDKTHGATITSATITGADAANFTLVSPSVFPKQVAAGDTIGVTVKFAPTRSGEAHAVLGLHISVDTSSYVLYDTLIANGVVAAGGGLCVSVSSIEFGKLLPQKTNNGYETYPGNWINKTFTITNCSSTPVVIGNDSSGQTSVGSITCDNSVFQIWYGNGHVTLKPNDSLSVRIQFSPTQIGNYSGTLHIIDSAQAVSAQVPISGSCDLYGYPRSTISPFAWDSAYRVYGKIGQSVDTSFWIHNYFSFPLTLISAGGFNSNNGWQDFSKIAPRTDYSVWPATIAPGDSLEVEFKLMTVTAKGAGAECRIQFKEASTFYFSIVGYGK